MNNKAKKEIKSILIIMLVISTTVNYGQDSIPDFQTASNIAYENPIPEPLESSETLALPLSRLEFILSLSILVFGIVIILLEIFLIKNKNVGPEDTIKFIVITIIIISTIFLITAGYSNDQIAPAFGLLGTIAGYLLGKVNSTPK